MAMNSSWKTHLQQLGARIDNDAVQGFGDIREEISAAADNNVIADLSHISLVQVQGDDAQDFLQGQLSNDIRAVTAEHSQLSAYCTPKGRMLAIFRIFQRDGDYYLQLPTSLNEQTIQRLRMYVLRAKVQLQQSELVHFGISGSQIARSLEAELGELPQQPDASITHQGITVIRLSGPQPRFDIIGEAQALIDLWNALDTQATAVGLAAWEWLDIMAGIPTVSPATIEAFVPQMANLELLDGVNFKKGCYPGQEIVARMHYLGRLKQRMYRLHLDGDAATAKAGDALYAPDFPNQSAGTVVAAQPAPGGGFDLLAVMQISSATLGDIHIGDAQGPALILAELPYAIPTTNKQ